MQIYTDQVGLHNISEFGSYRVRNKLKKNVVLGAAFERRGRFRKIIIPYIILIFVSVRVFSSPPPPRVFCASKKLAEKISVKVMSNKATSLGHVIYPPTSLNLLCFYKFQPNDVKPVLCHEDGWGCTSALWDFSYLRSMARSHP